MKQSSRIGLIDLEGGKKSPNHALMKLSAWHKQRGDSVEWYFPFSDRYDVVYASKVFSWTPDYSDVINADKVVRGGSGYAITLINGREVYAKEETLPAEIEHMFPDYSLYPALTKDTAYGYLTRGCPRGCSFCIVAHKEGKKSVRVADLNEFWNGQRNIVLLDPNILACKDWRPLLMQLIESGAWVDFNQGLDARMMTPEKATLLGEIKVKEIHFAWDRWEEGDKVKRGLEIYTQYARRRPRDKDTVVYTLVNYDTTFEQDLERIYQLRELGFYAYVMIYDKAHSAKQYHDLARWVNNRYVFNACKRFEDYNNQIKNNYER